MITGKAVQKRIRLDLTYDEIDNSAENVWSVLFTTGYLTRLGESENGMYKLVIPNKEVLEVLFFKSGSGLTGLLQMTRRLQRKSTVDFWKEK